MHTAASGEERHILLPRPPHNLSNLLPVLRLHHRVRRLAVYRVVAEQAIIKPMSSVQRPVYSNL
jgi:hypothetical protein